MLDAETIKAVTDAGIGVVAICVIAFLFYKADSRWNKTIEKMDEAAGKRQEAVNEILKELADIIRNAPR